MAQDSNGHGDLAILGTSDVHGLVRELGAVLC
jgi:hypothetical protein